MGLYNFQPRFIPMIKAGTKRHTIRANRVHCDKPGNTLYLYTGLRTKAARRIGISTCVKVETISIFNMRTWCKNSDQCAVEIDCLFLDQSEKDELAQRDGFQDFADMFSFWNGRLPFEGQIIHWDKVRSK